MTIIAIATGLVYAGLLYLFNRRQHYGKTLAALLFALRSIVVAAVMILFFNPYIKQKTNNIEHPVIVIAKDMSSSITITDDSLFYKEQYPRIVDSIADILNINHDIDTIEFGDEHTDINKVLADIKRQYYKRNVGAVLLFSDGIVNHGVNPELTVENFPFPIYTVTLGDTVSYPDLSISNVKFNKSVPTSMSFPLRVTVNANDAKNENLELTVKMDGADVGEIMVPVTSNRFSKTVDFNIMPESEGMKQIDIHIKGITNEKLQQNNSKRIFIEVVDRKYRVLCYAKSPNPDISAIKSAFGEHFEFVTTFQNDVEKSEIKPTESFDLLFVHQLPIPQEINGINIKKLPVMAVVGPSTDIKAFNESQNVVKLNKGVVNKDLDVKARSCSSFGLFTINSSIIKEIGGYPPLSLPYLEFAFESNHEDMFHMNILDLETSNPLMTFAMDNDRKVAILSGTGWWRWKLYEHFQHKNHEGFDELFSKTAKYLLTERKKELTVNHKESYMISEDVSFTAEILNPSLEFITTPELQMKIICKQTKKTYEYVFAKGDNNYHLNIGMLPEGIYTYVASASLGDIEYTTNGSFTVMSLGIESQDLTAKIDRMRSLSSQTGGRHYYISDLQDIITNIDEDSRITSISREETRYDDLINMRWLFFVILGLITMEWLLRKIFGTY